MHNNHFWSRSFYWKDSVSVQSLRFLIMRHFIQGGGDSKELWGSLALSTPSETGLSQAFFFKEKGKKQTELFEEFTTKLFSKKECSKIGSVGCGKGRPLLQAPPPNGCVRSAHCFLFKPLPFRVKSSAWDEFSFNNVLKAPSLTNSLVSTRNLCV